MTFAYEETSLKRLKGVHPDLVKVVYRAVELVEKPVLVVDGKRTIAQQRKYVDDGKSKTMNSRHLTGHAVDLVAVDRSIKDKNKQLLWSKPHATEVADAMQKAADELGVSIERGYDWGWDAPHFQLSWADYPRHEKWQKQTTTEKVATKAKKAPVSAPVAGIGLFALIFGWIEAIFQGLKDVALTVGDLAPVKSLFVQAGANPKLFIIPAIIMASALALKKWLEED